MPDSQAWVVGVDGCRAGWVAVAVSQSTGDLGVAEALVAESFAEVRHWCDEVGALAIGVDMPVGLPTDGYREADGLARRLLGPRRSSFFPTPARAVLNADSWDDASALSREASGKGISKQAFNLMPKVRQVRAVIGPGDQPRFSEVHPETSFAVMAELSGSAPLESKKTDDGKRQRRQLLEANLDEGSVGSILDIKRFPGVVDDDVLDALAAAWTANRMAAGVALILGSGIDPDGYALTVTV